MLKKLFPYILLILSLMLFSYVFFKSEIQWDGLKRNYYSIYYIISVIFLIISIFVFFLNDTYYEYDPRDYTTNHKTFGDLSLHKKNTSSIIDS